MWVSIGARRSRQVAHTTGSGVLAASWVACRPVLQERLRQLAVDAPAKWRDPQSDDSGDEDHLPDGLAGLDRPVGGRGVSEGEALPDHGDEAAGGGVRQGAGLKLAHPPPRCPRPEPGRP